MHLSHLYIRWTNVSGLLLFMTPQCINQPKYKVVSVHQLPELSSYVVYHFPPSVSCLTMSAGEVSGSSLFQVYFIPLLLIVMEISISKE